jgi:predicted P-loop ATPase
VPAEIARSAVSLVSRRAAFDSAHAWASALVWDGVPRIDTAMSRYFRTEDTPYTRAVGAYLFTAAGGRAITTGPLQCDMAVILVGLQGARKTSAVAALAPTPAAFGEVNLAKSDDDVARRLRGKLIVEWAEMRGLVGRDLEGIKAWTTRRTESWVPKYKEFETTFVRRCIVIGTANTTELLDDPTGERRWLPTIAGEVDVEALELDRDQLWAEGVQRFRASGVAWQEAERLARGEHAAFKVSDEWTGAIVEWLDRTPVPKMGEKPSETPNGERPFELRTVTHEALPVSQVTKREADRVGKILRNLGYESWPVRVGGALVKRWVTRPLPVSEGT